MSTTAWQNGISGDWSTSADWSSGTPSTGMSATIAAAGAYVVTLFGSGTVSSLTLNDQGAEFYDAGALNLAGTLALQNGTLALAYGAINGGTIAMQGGSLLATGGTLNGNTVDGTLNMSAPNATLFVQNGLKLAGSNGSGAGSLAMTGAYDTLDFIGSQSLSNATISIGASGTQPGQSSPSLLQVTHAGGSTSGATLTLGNSAWVRDQGGQAELVAGTISQLNMASLPDTLLNQGTVTVSGAGGTLTIAGNGNFINQGTLSASNGALLDLAAGAIQNTGLISVNNATLALGGTFSTAIFSTLGSVAMTSAHAEILGTGNIGGGTLGVGGGSVITGQLGALALAGTLTNGTVIDSGGGLNFSSVNGTLSGVNYQGVLALATAGSGVTLCNGTNVTGTGGGAGSLSVTGSAANLLLQGNETLNNAAIALGSAGQAASIGTSDAWLGSTAATATLGPQVSVTQTAANAALNANGFSPIPGFGLSDTLVNQGTITGGVAGTLSVGGYGSFINQGQITVSSGDTFAATVQQFANAGTITAAAGGTVQLGGATSQFGAAPAWSNAGLVAVTGGTLTLNGAVTTSQLGKVTQTQGLVQFGGVLNNAGATVALGTGATLNNVSLTGTVLGGTISDPQSDLSFGNQGSALLDGVTYNGTLSLTASGTVLRVRDGMTLNGLAAVTGAGSVLDFVGSQSFNNAKVYLGGAGSAATIEVTHNYAASTGSTLSLGGSLMLAQAGPIASIGAAGVAGDCIVSAATINVGYNGGTLTLGGPGFVNQGQINVGSGETLVLQSPQFSNTGRINVTGGVLSIGGSLTLAALGQVAVINSLVQETGTLALGGGTLTIGVGSAIGRVSLTGTIAGGTLIDNGQGLGDAGGATLAGVTYDGMLDLSRPFQQLAISQGITLAGQSGSGTGSIMLTGAASRLIASSNETLNNVAITLGSPAQSYLGQTLAAPELDAASGVQLTIGPSATITGAGTGGTIGNAGLGQWSDSIVNAGQILEGLAGGTLTVGATNFSNTGTMSAINGGVLTLGSAGFSNTGLLSIGTGSMVQLSEYNYFASPLSGATMLTNQGTISLTGSGSLAEQNAGGLFPLVPFANMSGGLISGSGTVAAPVSNAGTIDAKGGMLSVQGSLIGTGSLAIEANSTLDLAGSVAAGQVVSFKSTTGTLRLDQPGSFSGLISNFIGGDVIDLPGQTMAGLYISSTGSLVVNTASKTYTIGSTTPLTGALEGGKDGHGGATVSIVPGSGSGVGGVTVLGVSQPGMYFWTTSSGDELQGTTANINGLIACNWYTTSSLDLTDMSPKTAKLTLTPESGWCQMSITDGTHTAVIDLGLSLTSNQITLVSDGHTGTMILT